MADRAIPKYTFVSQAVPEDTFHVVKFAGTEGLSVLYDFNITLISENADIDIGELLRQPATFTIKHNKGELPFHGVLSVFKQQHRTGGMVFYRARLVPSLWWATLTQHNQIFLDKDVQEFLDEVLRDSGLMPGLNYDFKLQRQWPPREYVCQYNETNFNFISRWMERNGLYYYFEQDESTEKMIITDSSSVHTAMPEGGSLRYAPPSNLNHADEPGTVTYFVLRQQRLPKKVLLKDYNYRKPSVEIQAESVVSKSGMGEVYIYGEHFQTPKGGKMLADIRAEELRCREKIYHGTSSAPSIRSGYVFDMTGHYSNAFNCKYLVTEVSHEGCQEAYLVSGLGLRLAKNKDRLYYKNSFTCIPATTQFRAEHLAEKPRFPGSMNAMIDASGSGKYAELDDQGRYKVVLPLDLSGRSSGKATAWIRMAQPYGGAGYGMHFPLHKGTEVLLTCVDGDPDRPIIQAAVPNPETPSPIIDTTESACVISTAGGNSIIMEDQADKQHVFMNTPTETTSLRMGSHVDPSQQHGDDEADGFYVSTKGDLVYSGDNEKITLSGDRTEEIEGDLEQTVKGEKKVEITGDYEVNYHRHRNDVTSGGTEEFHFGNKLETLVGFSEEFKFAECLEVNLFDSIGVEMSKIDLTVLELGVVGMTTEVAGVDLSIADIDYSIVNSEFGFVGVSGEAVLDELVMVGLATEIAAATVDIVGMEAAVKGAVLEVVGVEGTIKGVVGEVVGSSNDVEAEDLDLKGMYNGLAGLFSFL